MKPVTLYLKSSETTGVMLVSFQSEIIISQKQAFFAKKDGAASMQETHIGDL